MELVHTNLVNDLALEVYIARTSYWLEIKLTFTYYSMTAWKIKNSLPGLTNQQHWLH